MFRGVGLRLWFIFSLRSQAGEGGSRRLSPEAEGYFWGESQPTGGERWMIGDQTNLSTILWGSWLAEAGGLACDRSIRIPLGIGMFLFQFILAELQGTETLMANLYCDHA